MKWIILFSLLFALAASDESPLAELCDEELCQLPNCRCSTTSIPGGLAARDTPQFVLITFDDNVNVVNVETYREILYGHQNSNGCPASFTFYVNHEYNNYQLVNELYNQGFEIALHSISHQTPSTYWQEATTETMAREFGDQKIQMSHFANIPYESLTGVRIPFLQLGGNSSFEAMAQYGLEYDCTWPTISHVNPGLWPYTLDYASTQDCVILPCPTASVPGVWVVPMVSWIDLNGTPCSMVDSCSAVPDLTNEEEWYRFILRNFERHYLGNRAPFGFYIHEWYLAVNPAVKRALARFMDQVAHLNDAFMVNTRDMLEWVKNPIPLDEYKQQQCKGFTPAPCPASSCGPLATEHNTIDYWMQICNVCPRVYPWLGNPLGL